MLPGRNDPGVAENLSKHRATLTQGVTTDEWLCLMGDLRLQEEPR
jgi:hypothetical protein